MSKVALFLLLSIPALAQDINSRQAPIFDLVRKEYSGDVAFATTAFVEQYWRIAGNTGYDTTVHYIAAKLEAAGFVEESKALPSSKLTYRIEKRAMKRPTWEPVDAELTIEGQSSPLLKSTTNRNMTALNSFSTPEGGVSGEVVKLEKPTDIGSTDVKGKIVYISGAGPGAVFTKAYEAGAVGIMSYSNPGYLQPEKNKTSIQFRSVPMNESLNGWGIALSYDAKEKLEASLASGPTRVHVTIHTKVYPSEELTIIADAHGIVNDERLVFSAHIQEPGANDNASGVGAQLEMALTTAKLINTGKLKLNRTITFLWGDEIISTRRYIQEDKERAKNIKWGISLDMVGENTALTGGTFLIEKMPDPSAIWTRGNDKHTEWGAGDVKLDDMRPHYLNDFIINTMKQQGKFANWIVNANPFEGGSDHTPFIDAKIPGLLMWHFTDQFYHTDNDRIDKVSKETLRNVGTGALVAAITLVNSDSGTGKALASYTLQCAKQRLDDEFNLSKASIESGGDSDEEIKIMTAWKDWYTLAVTSARDTAAPKDAASLEKTITDAVREIDKLFANYINQLKSK